MHGFKWMIAIFMIILRENRGLKIIEVVVPKYRMRGDPAVLECKYELHGGSLYSVKWYKDSMEFYRYMPRFNPPQHSHKIDGIKVDHQMSNDTRVQINGLTLKSSGTYRCEVSAEAPGFSSAGGEGRLQVVYLPRDGPFITETDREYKIGETLHLNCTSGKSFPPSSLHWYVNDEKITEPEALVDYGELQLGGGLASRILGLELLLREAHVRGGLRARCVAAAPWPERDAPPGAAALPDKRDTVLLVKSGSARIEKRLIWISALSLCSLVKRFY